MRDCPDACSIIATVEDGRVIRQRGNPDHGITRGFLCVRGNNYLKRQYDAARLLHPLRRTGNGWERLSWDQALDLVADKLAAYRDTWGPHSILAVQYSGLRGWVAKVLSRLFWAQMGGVTMTRGGLSIELRICAGYQGECKAQRKGRRGPPIPIEASARPCS